MEFIDSFLNKITMYRLTLYYLISLVAAAICLSFFKLLPFKPLDIAVSTLLLMVFCAVANYLFAKIFNAITNVESVFITALIMALIIPLSFSNNLKFLIEVSVFSMAIKYLLTIEKRHLFNPVAGALVIVSLLTSNSATWWIGTPIMLPFVIVGGLLLVRKIRRENLVFSFLLFYFLIIGLDSILNSGTIPAIITTWKLSITHSALFFFTFVMLTEPMTSPSTRKMQGFYGYLVALFYATPQLRILSISFTPEMALVLGNVFSFFVSPNYRLDLILKSKNKLSADTYQYDFDRPSDFKFIPGQYMEWTLPHVSSDARGNRRYFSISSSPTESEISMTVKFYNPSSSFKTNLLNMKAGGKIIATQVAGDFILPKDLKKPIAFIAGGVGVAPFRSMIKYIVDKNINVDITLFYSNRNIEEIFFSDIFEKARDRGVKTVYVLTNTENIPENWTGKTGYITDTVIKEKLPDFLKRVYYVSGPQLMVQNFEKILKEMKIPTNQIVTDFFPGYTEKI